jgi:hypothetical protein
VSKKLVFAFCLSLAADAALAQGASAIGSAAFDGVWTFSSTTSAGNCPSLTPGSVTVKGGYVVAANGGAAAPWGYVEGDGTLVARFTVAGHISRATGALRGDAGQGAWSSSTDFCGGAWRAQRSARAGR